MCLLSYFYRQEIKFMLLIDSVYEKWWWYEDMSNRKCSQHMTTAIVIYKLMRFPNKKNKVSNSKEPNICFHISRMLENYITTFIPRTKRPPWTKLTSKMLFSWSSKGKSYQKIDTKVRYRNICHLIPLCLFKNFI